MDREFRINYDLASQTMRVIQHRSARTTLQQLDYRYNNAGKRIEMIEGGVQNDGAIQFLVGRAEDDRQRAID